ncbi:MAG: hypothetical protein ACREJO_04280 [Phycisphaerales bacterium]
MFDVTKTPPNKSSRGAWATAVGGATGTFTQLTKFKGGFVGRMFGLSAVAVICVLGIFAAAAYWKVEIALAIAGLASVLLIALLFGAAMFVFAWRNPELATLEGKEVLQYQRLQIATKFGVTDDGAPPTTDPSVPLPDRTTIEGAIVPDEPPPPRALPGGASNG